MNERKSPPTDYTLRFGTPSHLLFFSHEEQTVTDIGFDDFRFVTPLTVPRYQEHSTLHFVLSGEGQLEIGEHRFSVAAGEFFSVPSGVSFRYYPIRGREWSYIWFGVAGEGAYWLREAGFSVQEPLRPAPESAAVAERLAQMIEVCRENSTASYLRAKAVFFSLIAELMDRAEGAPKESRPLPSSHHSAVTGAILSLINANYANPALTVEMLCRIVHVSHPYVCKIFRRETGQTVMSAIIERRMVEARRRLRGTERIADIAEAVGYGDVIHFSKEFRRRHGVSPLAYRKGQTERGGET